MNSGQSTLQSFEPVTVDAGTALKDYYTDLSNKSLQDTMLNLQSGFGNQLITGKLGNYQTALNSANGNVGLTEAQTGSYNTLASSGIGTAAANAGLLSGIMEAANPNATAQIAKMTAAQDTLPTAAASMKSNIQKTLEKQAAEELALGGTLTAEEERTAQQAARTASSAAGRTLGNLNMAQEVLGTDAASTAREAQRRTFAQGVDATSNQLNQNYFTNLGTTLSGINTQQVNPFNVTAQAGSTASGVGSTQMGLASGATESATGQLLNNDDALSLASANASTLNSYNANMTAALAQMQSSQESGLFSGISGLASSGALMGLMAAGVAM